MPALTSSNVRNQLVDALKLDLVGPWPEHPFANELLPESPTRWYLTGYLVTESAPVEFLAAPDATIQNLRRILGEIAEELQRSGLGHFSLNAYKTQEEKPFAELLWRLSGSMELDEDARRRVSVRSLLGRIANKEAGDEWEVDFCHRSMREYFVAIRLCQAVEAGKEPAAVFLKTVPLNHEILQFATERWRKTGAALAKERLLDLLGQARHEDAPGRLGGYALTLLFRLDPVLPSSFDWTGKVFDGADLEEANLSGLDFSRSFLRYGNLANANLENTNFEDCDLTGARVEETNSVVSLATGQSGTQGFALYG